jgi:hypothetical protein
MENIVGRLRNAGVIKGKIIVCDATFIEAYSKRDPIDDSGVMEILMPRVGRAGKSTVLAISFI